MKKDWILFTDIVLIVAIGLTTLYSTVIGTQEIFTGGGVVNRQLIFVLIGFGLYFAVSFFDYRFTGHPQVLIPLYLIVVGLLLYLLFWGVEINNAKRWIIVGGIQLQPSEFAKLVVILGTSWILSLRHKYNVWLLAGISFVLTLIVGVLIFLEPDASTAIILMTVWGFMVFSVLPFQLRNIFLLAIAVLSAFGLNFLIIGNLTYGIALVLFAVGVSGLGFVRLKSSRILVVAALVVGLVLGFGLRMTWDNILADYQKQRIETFVNPSSDTQGAGFQVDQSKVAIGSGMLWGKGFGHGTQSKLNFLPEHQTDFIFAAFAEEFGLIGSLFLLTLYGVAVLRIFQNSTVTNEWYGSLICVGIGVKLMLEIFINIGMNVGMIPATGIPLPLMSAGGSIFLVTMLGFGLVQSVRIHAQHDEGT